MKDLKCCIDFANDRTLKERVLAEKSCLKSFGLTADSPGLIIFRIPHGQAHYWTMEIDLKSKEIFDFKPVKRFLPEMSPVHLLIFPDTRHLGGL
jgi:hypothetical protein